jgi:hypothetical protein
MPFRAASIRLLDIGLGQPKRDLRAVLLVQLRNQTEPANSIPFARASFEFLCT